MTKMRRFPVDPQDADVAELDDVEAPPRKRPADKRWKRPHADKTRPGSGAPEQES